jgi:CDP-diglyceride synthetase
LISPDKNNEMLVFTFMPLSVMCTTNIEYSQSKMYQEIVLLLLITGCFFSFFSQL